MKSSIVTTILVLLLINVFAQSNPETSKAIFQDAKMHLENMLTNKETPNYEQALFTIENAWYDNKVDKVSFDKIINHQIEVVRIIYKANYNFDAQKAKATLEFSKADLEEKYKKALLNWSIYSYITQNIQFNDSGKVYVHPSFDYSTADPMASNNWQNSQVLSLLTHKKGNCFALASLFKILSERLNSEAKLCTAPSHIYISHADEKGTIYNVELGSKKFPGTGTISAVTYSTDQAIKNNISQRELTTEQSIALCLVYLAKGYEHKFNNATDDFILQCAETALKYDDHNLNAMLLKAEYLENKLTTQQKPITQLQSEKQFQEYQNLIANLYDLGYREMPLEMKNKIIKSYKNENNLSNKINTKNIITTKGNYATATWGLFDERHTLKATERISNTIFNTKTKKITSFSKEQNLYNSYNFDPIVFAWNIDPMADRREWVSPYNFVQNNPINRTDPSGALDDIVIHGENNSSVIVKTTMIDVEVNVSSLGIGFGGNYTLQGDEILQASLDIVGIVDPTGVADVINAGISADKGNWGDMIISGIGVVPYVGDLAKAGKIGKDVKVIENAVEALTKAEKEEGIIYKRIEKGGKEKDYIGKAKSEKRYDARQKEHQRANKDKDYEFSKVDKGKPGRDLSRKEQKHIDAGGGPTNKSNPNGGLSNKRNEIKK